ncbi:BOLA class I histocompatibility antigen [Huso huso]|uniref:BOLA class I histocompatibility antigen n=1 Tax=Huso huso TaxID=61971 RepID=A0ABR0YBK1_HUSHU
MAVSLLMQYQILAVLLTLLLFNTSASAVTHRLDYLFTATTKNSGLPSVVAVAIIDGVQIEYYDGNTKEVILRQDWIENVLEPKAWTTHVEDAIEQHNKMERALKRTMMQFNHTKGIHTYQRWGGCEVSEEGSKVYWNDAYDGNYFIKYDDKNQTWTATMEKASFFTRKWEASRWFKEFIRTIFQDECIKLLKKYSPNVTQILERKVPPEVRLFQKKADHSAGSGVTCHVTGFYPREVEVTWLRDGQGPLEEGVWSGEVLPNMDGTYQVRKTLTVSPEEQKRHRYTCQVDHASLGENIEKEWVPETGLHPGLLAGVVLGVPVLIAVIAGLVIWKKRQAGANQPDYKPAHGTDQSEVSSNSSNSS